MKRKNKLRKTFTRIIAGIMSVSVMLPATPLWASQSRMTTAPPVGEISVSPEIRYQTLKGWGTSLCWWGNIIGSWGDADYNKNGTPDREEIAELAFSPEYLNLNIVRYNVGGGDKEDTSIKRCEGLVPGWTEDMTGTKNGTGAYDEAAFLAKSTEQMADAGQLWMLEQANSWRKQAAEENGTENDIINEVFSNSPPYYMTKSGSSTGGKDDANNLRDDQYGAFATYLARAAKWINQDLTKKYGTKVDLIEPLNEPDTNYWWNGSTKQEGCIFNTGELQSKAYQEMKKALNAEGLGEIQITGTDETDLGTAINSYNRLADDVKQNMTTIGAHTYSGSDSQRKELRRAAQSDDKDLWMSEVTKGGSGHNHNSMEAVNAKSQSEGIMADLKYMQPTAWIAWLLADSEYECIQTDSNWGLLHATFEKDGKPVEGYHTNIVTTDDARYKEGYWAITKQFYTMMQYSKFLKQGYIMVDVEDGNMCAAIAPDGSELVIVAQNFGKARSTTVDLGKFMNIGTAEMYRTSDREDCQKMAYAQDVSDHVLDVDLPKNSVTTYVIKAVKGKTVCDMDSSVKTVDADVVKGAEWASDIDKFQYTGKWGESGSCDGKYATADGTAVTFKFSGTRARIYGTRGAEGGNVAVSVDGGGSETISLSGAGKNVEALLFDTGKLSEGNHTVTMTRQSGLLEVNYAQVISGDYNLAEVQPCDPVYTVSGVAPVLPEKVKVTVGEAEEERKVAWNTEDADFSGKSKKVTLEGSVSGVSQKASIDVYIVMENAVYFIDCNSPDSAEIEKYADLVNETADQKYGNGNTWGYLEEYNGHGANNSDIYESGWYSKGKGETFPIQYQFPLKAGDYKITVGSKEWWTDWNSSREMKVSVKQGEKETELGTTNTYNKNGNSWNKDTFEFTCSEDTDIVFSVKAVSSGQDAILSFLQVQKNLDLNSLKEALKTFNAMDESKFASKPQELAALKKAAADGHKLLYLASATQAAVDAAAADIEQKMEALGTMEIVLNQKTLEANDYVLYTANCGTPDPYRIPNKESQRLGLLQSSVDQQLGKDNLTGYTWGRDEDTEFAKAKVYGSGDAVDIGNSFIYLSEDITYDKAKTALGYTFEVPDLSEVEGMEPDTFEVTVAMKQPWGSKNANILLEGRTYATDISYGSGEWVSRTFTVPVKDGKLNVQVKNPRRKDGGDDPVLNYIKVRAVKHTEPEIVTYDSITGTAGAPLYDTEGKLIQAHGGQIQQLTVDGETKWYWIGEDKTYDYRPCGGIHMYSSTDLYNWKDEGVVLKTMESMDEFETDDYFKSLYEGLSETEKEDVFEDLDRNNCVMERPKMLYNDTTGKYVIWFHADGRTRTNPNADYGKAKAGVAIGDSPVGPFKLLGTYKLNSHNDPNGNLGYDGWENRGSVRDMNLFKEDDGTAYVIYSSEGNQTTYISKLNAEYTGLAKDRDEAVEGVDFIRAFGWSREAPAMFKYKDKYYIVNSGCTGWSPNPAECWTADSIFGTWKPLGDPCTDWGSGTTYDTQSTCVIPVDPEKGYYIYMGDRWNAGDLSESRYVWLPVIFKEDGGIELKRYDNWKLEEVWDMTKDADTTELQKAITAAESVNRNEADYTSVSWKAYEDALKNAKKFVETPGKFQSAVNSALAALNHAVKGLKTLTEALDEALEAYGTLPYDREEYKEASLKAYDDALKAAQDLKKAGKFTETELNEVTGLLKEAFEGMKRKIADITELQREVTAAEEAGRNASDYTAASWAAYESALEKAKRLLANPGEDQTVVDNAVKALQNAVEGLTTLEYLLGAALDAYAVNPDIQDQYTQESWKAYDDALKAVQALQGRDNLTEAQVNQAIGKLKDAYYKLIKEGQDTPEEPKTPEEALDKYGTPEGSQEEYTEESWNKYQAALKAVKDLQESGNYTEEEMQQAIKALSEAFKGLAKTGGEPSVVPVAKITVSGSSKKLLKGKKMTLKANVLPADADNKAVAWSSSNKKAATVDSKGVVTAKGAGTVTITATAKDGSGVKGSYKITVTDAVTKITLSSGTKGIAVGKKVTVKPTVKVTGKTANKKLSWSSSNKKYAAVNSKGVVTAKKAGAGKTVTVTAKATDGSGKSGKVKIKIVKHAVKKITLKCKTKTVKAGKKTTVKATVKTTGKTANKTLSWTTSNKKYATISSKGVVTAKKAGRGKTVTITARATDGTGKKAKVKIKIKK